MKLKLYSVAFLCAVAGLASTALTAPTPTPAPTPNGFFDSAYTFVATDGGHNNGITLDLGAAGRTHHYAIFGADGDVSASDTNGVIDITGDVGVNGNMSLSGAILSGDLYIKNGKTVSLGTKGSISGKTNQDKKAGGAFDTMLAQGAADSLTLSNSINSLAVQNNGIYGDGADIVTNNSKFSITGGANQVIVLKLRDFVMTGGELDLMGTATTKFIINVSRNFALSGGAKVVNGGALLASNVIFNYRGTGIASLGGGSVFNGILLARNSTIQMTGASRVNGELIGKSVVMSGGSKVGPTLPPVVSP